MPRWLALLALCMLPAVVSGQNEPPLVLRWEVGASDSTNSVRTVARREEAKVRSDPWWHSMRMGVIGGFAFSQVDGDGYGGYRNPGGIVGLWVRQPLGKRWGWRLDLRYQGRGSRSGLVGSEVRRQAYIFYLHYLELWLGGEWRFVEQWGIGAGLAGEYLLAWSEANAYGPINQMRPQRAGLLGYGRLGWYGPKGWTLSVGAEGSILPFRGKPQWVPGGRRTGQFHNALSLWVEYAF